MSEPTADPGMTTKEWLQRIEGHLERIEDKLDTKADTSALIAIESRVRLMETVGTPQSQTNNEQVNTLRDELGKLKVKVYAVLAAIGILAAVGEILRQGITP